MMTKSQKSTFTALTMRRHQLLGASAMAFCLLDHDKSPEFRRDIDGRLFQSRYAKSTSEIEQQNELSRDGVQKRKRPAHWPAQFTKNYRGALKYPIQEGRILERSF